MTGAAPAVHGACADRFDAVRVAFEESFRTRGERGAGVCVTHRGEVVVDLVGGVADDVDLRPWQDDTIAMVWSCTKGALALCVHLLVAAGELELDAPIARWWPEFAAHGKGDVTVAMGLSHQAGVPGLSEPLPHPDVVYEWDEMCARVARQAPLWEPGTRHGYHSATFGWIAGELVRRVSGLPPGEFLARHVAGPLGLDLWIGLPAAEDARVARARYPALATENDSPFGRAVQGGEPIQVAALNAWGRFVEAGVCQLREARAAQVPGGNGFASARALAGLYAPLATDGRVGDVVLSDAVRRRMGAVHAAGACDAVRLLPTRYAAGFEKSRVARAAPGDLLLGETALGHAGYGGSIGFADPACKLSIGYVTSCHAAEHEQERQQALLDAAYAAAGAPLESHGAERVGPAP